LARHRLIHFGRCHWNIAEQIGHESESAFSLLSTRHGLFSSAGIQVAASKR